MSDNTLIPSDRSDLLDIFSNEEDKKGTDLLNMTDYLSVLTEKSLIDIRRTGKWRRYSRLDNWLGQISSAIKSGISVSEQGTLVADIKSLSDEIRTGLSDGTYHIGLSKQVKGNLRPAILDDKGKIVKQLTLKKINDPSLVLGDISVLCIQSALDNISNQLEEIQTDIKELISFERRIHLSSQFFKARDRVIRAASTDDNIKRDELLEKADEYLMDGLQNLYVDIYAQIGNITGLKLRKTDVEELNKILNYISEDMLMIPKYVGLRVYLLEYRQMHKEASLVIEEYQYKMEQLSASSEDEYSGFELVHSLFKYNKENRDFWIENPPKIIDAIASYNNKNIIDAPKVFVIEEE